jgi:hypothetical protein
MTNDTTPSNTSPSASPPPRSQRLLIIGFAFAAFLAANYLILRVSGHDPLQMTATWITAQTETVRAAVHERQVRNDRIKVDADQFAQLFQEICPELLARYGIPLSQVYADLLRQYDGQTIDESFIRQMLQDWKGRHLSYDGKSFYRMDGKGQPGKIATPIDPALLKKDTVPIKFFLQNEKFYSRHIFEILTHQKDVGFAHHVNEKGEFVFEARRDMTQAEFLKVMSTSAAPQPDQLIRRGARWNIPEDSLREIPRVFEVQKTFTDHRGTKRTVTVYLDLSTYQNVSSFITTLPDGTLLANDTGPLKAGEDITYVTRIDGALTNDGDSWSYEEGGKTLFRVVDGACTFSSYGPCADMSDAEVWYEAKTDKHVFSVTIHSHTTSIGEPDGTKYRVISATEVKDGAGKLVTDPNDIGAKVQRVAYRHQGMLSSVPNLDAYVDTGPFMQKLAHDIGATYASTDDKAQAMLAFVHSFRYSPGMILSYAKGPKEYLLSLEGDCKDASIFAASLWLSAGFSAAFDYLNATEAGKAGHAAPLINKASCCSGAGITQGTTTWLYGEATGKDWLIGQDPNYRERGLVEVTLQPHGKPPVLFR